MLDPILVADIGGTNARFAVATSFDVQANTFSFEHFEQLSSNEFSHLNELMAHYLSNIPIMPKRACFAVAGPKKGDTVYLTNLGWQFKPDVLSKLWGFDEFEVINDFAAFALAAPYIKTPENVILKSGRVNPNGNLAVVGPGTGFGAAALIGTERRQVLSCEAGHMSLAATTNLERSLLQALSKEHEHVSIEHVLSGPGIENLYQAMASVHGTSAHNLSAAEIVQRARVKTDEICEQSVLQFCNWLGSVAGDISLAFNASGGLYIGGGIMPRLIQQVGESAFTERFSAKGKMTHLLSDIPVTLITQQHVPLIGSAANMKLI